MGIYAVQWHEGFERLLKKTIVEAGSLLLREAARLEKGARHGDRHDVDLVVSQHITNAIRTECPSHGCLSEEDPDRLPLDAKAFTWIIDPIDGSDNFYRGTLAYTISISLVKENETLLGAVYEPYVDRLFFARRGGGATLNGRPLSVSETETAEEAIVATSRVSSFRRAGRDAASALERLASVAEIRISASTALDLCYVASGAVDGRVLADTRVWDHSAGVLIVEEAGGAVTDWDGNAGNWHSRRLLASNGRCHAALLSILNGTVDPPTGAGGTFP